VTLDNNIDRLSTNKLAFLVTYTWGWAPNVARYTSWDNDISHTAETFTSDVTLDFSCEPQHGSVQDATFVVTQSVFTQPLASMVRPYPHAPVRVKLEEVDPEQPTTRRLVFSGEITKTKKNPSGSRNLVQATVSGPRRRIAFPIGIPANTKCPWVFGDRNCCKDVEALHQVGTISSITGSTIVTAGLAPPASPPNYWRWGWVDVDDLVIDVLEYGAGTSIKLKRVPPPEWVGRDDAKFYPGCGKTLDYCRAWDNEKNFGGIGIKIPAYHPVIEDGGEL
jgi:hypothetical protein